mmetsp:Transcript_10316/g.14190  ORF Transcript_10316/g.14190 Transcript_10316/m.14190 type:complete len:252 (+) Transcript_10316:682-1437(+)
MADLYMERLREYNELAALYDANYKDTVDEAEMVGGVIEGGTWEHRKRAKEMLATAKKNLELTARADTQRGHHMADYLPSSVLDNFLKKSKAITQQDEAAAMALKLQVEAEANQHKLNESNVGFQLLKKSGWIEGSGLGAQGTGIANPIAISSLSASLAAAIQSVNSSLASAGGVALPLPQSVLCSADALAASSAAATAAAIAANLNGAGLGARSTHELESTDNEFDQYRKRMMLAYKFRPNPLNNPRRDYY